MRSFLVSALALFNLFGGALVEGYFLEADPVLTQVSYWDQNNITFSVGFVTKPSVGEDPKYAVLQGADCNPNASVKNVTNVTKSVLSMSVHSLTTKYEFEIANASLAPSLYDGEGLPSFCVRAYFEGPVALDSMKVETINELFVSFSFNKTGVAGLASFIVDPISIARANATEIKGTAHSLVRLLAGRAGVTGYGYPSSYKMGSLFYLCVKSDMPSFNVSTFKTVTCSNDGATRKLVVTNDTNITFDPLTSSYDPTVLLVEFPDIVRQGDLSMQCIQSYVTAGFFSGSDSEFNCVGTAMTVAARRRLDGVEGRSLQELDEVETPFAATFSLDTAEYDILTASASVVGAGLSIASILLAMII